MCPPKNLHSEIPDRKFDSISILRFPIFSVRFKTHQIENIKEPVAKYLHRSKFLTEIFDPNGNNFDSLGTVRNSIKVTSRGVTSVKTIGNKLGRN